MEFRRVLFRSKTAERLLVDDDRAGVMLVEMFLDDAKIARVRAEEEVEGVADERHGAERGVDAEVADHAPDLPFRHAEVARFPDEIGAHRRGADVADDGAEADDRVEADGAIDARNAEPACARDFPPFDARGGRGGGGPGGNAR